VLLAVHYRVTEHLGSLVSTTEGRVALGYRLEQLYASFVLSKLGAKNKKVQESESEMVMN